MLLILLSSFCSYAQDSIEIKGDIELATFVFNENLPFWFHTNTGTFLNDQTNLAARINATADYAISQSHTLQLGIGGFYRDGRVTQEFQRNNLYLRYQNNLIKATIGSKEVEDKFQGLGVVRDNFSLSGNARALPGLQIELTKPIHLIKSKLLVDGSIAHYNLNDDRFVTGTRIHNKRLDLIWQFKSKSKLTLGVEHFAQWGGVSPTTGEQPTSFSDFVDVFFARRGGEEATNNDQLNSLGNSLGYYKFQYDWSSVSGNYSLYHHHPFEDGSGTRLRNFPDGIWGFYYSLDEKKEYSSMLKGFLLEYVSTVSQSGRFGRSGRDNYFNNRIYRDGWTFEGNTIGLPFISVPSNTRIEAFHFGILTRVKKIETRAKLSFVTSKGTFFNEIDPATQQLYTFLENTYSFNGRSKLKLTLGVDFNINFENNLGAGLSYLFKL